MPKLYIGPMSKNVVDAAIEFSNGSMMPVGFCASRRQIEYDGGYVNNWTTKSFIKYVRNKTQNSTLIRDHGGPGQGSKNDDGTKSFECDTVSFDIIHIDPWKKSKSLKEGIIKTAKYMTFCNNINENCKYEVGTEQAIRELSVNELFLFLKNLKKEIGKDLFKKIVYVVIQSGTSLEEDRNIGNYSRDKLTEVLKICKEFSVLSKEHNGDYLSSAIIKEKFSLGLNAINIAPEFGIIETSCVLNRMAEVGFMNQVFDLCYKSDKWKKWVSGSFDPFLNKEQLIKICCHYLFSDDRFKEIMKNEIFDGINNEIKFKIKKRIKDILGV